MFLQTNTRNDDNNGPVTGDVIFGKLIGKPMINAHQLTEDNNSMRPFLRETDISLASAF